MSDSRLPSRVAVIGAGVAGAACAASLHRAGAHVVVFDKSRGVGGRMATRRARWTDEHGADQYAELDHGAQHFAARHPRFKALMARAAVAGHAAVWHPRVHVARPIPLERNCFVALPSMPALCKYVLADVPLRLEHAVQRLQRSGEGWHVVVAGGAASGPFNQVILAMPPAQAALLLAGHNDPWADSLASIRMDPCWTLMAVTGDVDWPWDAAEPRKGPLAWVARNDRKPGRTAPPGCVSWVAHATPAWSTAHLEADSEEVRLALCKALQRQLPTGQSPQWHHSSVHRWRYAVAAQAAGDGTDCWWDADLGLGVCGDFLGSGDVESAWRSGDELADTVAAWLEDTHGTAAVA